MFRSLNFVFIAVKSGDYYTENPIWSVTCINKGINTLRLVKIVSIVYLSCIFKLSIWGLPFSTSCKHP